MAFDVARFELYSITSSARASSDGGIVRPSALAVLMLMMSSNLVGCSTGRSEGVAPFRILSAPEEDDLIWAVGHQTAVD